MGDRGDAFAQKVADELRAEKGRKKDRAKPPTFDELVEKTGLARSTLNYYFSGSRDIPMSSFIEICAALGVEPKTIFDRAQEALEKE